MKKFGYTLAEVLITLTIVGVVAALTIPTLVANSRNKANASKLSATITAVENALTSMMASDGVNDLTETVYYSKASKPKEAMAELSNYLKISSSDGENCVTKNGTKLIFDLYKEAKEKDGSSIGFPSITSIGTLEMHVNGNEEKSKVGRSYFKFQIGGNGTLYPAGSDIYKLFDDKIKLWEDSKGCSGGEPNLSCTARLIEEGFQVNY